MGSRQPGRLAVRVAPALVGALGMLIALTGPSAAQGVVRSVHSDWQIRCDTPPGAQGEQCALIQSVTAEDRANATITVIVLKTADNKARLLRVVAPMWVLLPSGPLRPGDEPRPIDRAVDRVHTAVSTLGTTPRQQ